MVALYSGGADEYIYLVDDAIILTLPHGEVRDISRIDALRESFVRTVSWGELHMPLQRAVATLTDPRLRFILYRFLGLNSKHHRLQMPSIDDVLGSAASVQIPVYRHLCHVWSDGEEEHEEDHNSSYDFDYFRVSSHDDPFLRICCVSSGHIMTPHEKEDSDVVRHIPLTAALAILDKGSVGEDPSDARIRLMFGLDHVVPHASSLLQS